MVWLPGALPEWRVLSWASSYQVGFSNFCFFNSVSRPKPLWFSVISAYVLVLSSLRIWHMPLGENEVSNVLLHASFSPGFGYIKFWMLWPTNLTTSPLLSIFCFSFFVCTLVRFLEILFVSLRISHSSLGGFFASNFKPKTSNCPEGKSCLKNISSALCGSLFLTLLDLSPSIPGCFNHFPTPSVRQLLLLLFSFIVYWVFYLFFPE